jgi:hypothetical protein
MFVFRLVPPFSSSLDSKLTWVSDPAEIQPQVSINFDLGDLWPVAGSGQRTLPSINSGNPALSEAAHIVERIFDLLRADGIIVVSVFEKPGFGFLDCHVTDRHIPLQRFFD